MAADKKLWNRADVRAEMNRMVKEATDACKKLHDVAGRIAALGVETNFVDDATVAIAALKKRVEIAPVMVIDSIGKLGDTEASKKVIDAWKKFNPLGPNVRVVPQDESKPLGPNGNFALRPTGETWGDRGCTCGARGHLVSAPLIVHGRDTTCPFRDSTPGWERA